MMNRKLEINGQERQIHNLPFDKVRKRPIVVRAARITRPFRVQTLEGIMKGKAGDILIIGVSGEAYPCDYEVFKKTYENLDGSDIEWIIKGGSSK